MENTGRILLVHGAFLCSTAEQESSLCINSYGASKRYSGEENGVAGIEGRDDDAQESNHCKPAGQSRIQH
jgi:hypothetical protein